MKTVFYVMALSILILSGFQPSECEASYCGLDTYVFYGNGMFSEQSSAESSLRRLKRKVMASGDLTDEAWDFELSYNDNEGVYSLFEVYRQSMGDQASSFWRWLGNLEIAPDWFQESMYSLAKSFDYAESMIDADLSRHVQRYQNLLMEGSRVLVVAHSQGNYYANSAYTRLASDNQISMDAFGIVSVATPASRVAGGGPYFTLMDDLVISAVQVILPSTLPGNVSNTTASGDWKHHSFVDSYLNGDQSGAVIVSNVIGSALGLEWPEPQVGNGPISVTLTWGSEPDVDLHVYEPDGRHVYYEDMVGTSGSLDFDDVRSGGPEHYYVSDCESLTTGTYLVGVNYYYGEAPETAHVQVQAGDIIRDYSIGLLMPEGSYGNDNPAPVASIEVLGDDEQGYEFNVEISR